MGLGSAGLRLGIVAGAALALSLLVAAPASAAFPGQNGKIYFEACYVTCSVFDVYSVNPDGTGLDNVTDVVTSGAGPPDSAFDPSVSGDGARMVFNVDTQATGELWAMNTDGTNPQRLTDDNLLDFLPSISADGSKVVWTNYSPNPCPPSPPAPPGCVVFGDRDIWLMNSDGSDKRLLFDGFGEDHFPEWTPDGQTVVMGAETGDSDIRKIPSTPASPPLQVADPVAEDNALVESQPSVSPDGTKVVFTHRPLGPCCPQDLSITGINGGPVTPFAATAAVEWYPAWSPDGSKIAYVSDNSLVIANVDGSGAPAPVDIGSPVSIGSAEWAPAVAEPPAGGEAGDAQPPNTLITKQPKDKTKTKRATFEFSAGEPATFECALDGKQQFKACTSPLTVKVKRGKHSFEVRATDAAGNADPSPATDGWKVKKKKKK
jgi:Tol biopolymer transport system component